MRLGSGNRARPPVFYGWWLVLAGIVVVGCGMGLNAYCWSQLPHIVKRLGGSPSQMGLTLSVYHAVPATALLAIGPLIDRFGPRKLMLIGIPLASIGYGCLGAVDRLSILHILQGLIAIGMSAGFLLPAQTAIANWFVRRRSIALAGISAASVLGGLVAKFLAERMAIQPAWPDTLLWLGLVLLGIGLPLALMIRHRPEDYGYLPDGKAAIVERGNEPSSQHDHAVEEISFTWRQALRTRTLWMLALAMALATGAGMVRSIFLPQQGFDAATIQRITEIGSVMGVVGILVFGYLGDLFPKRNLLALAVVLQSISIVFLMTGGGIGQIFLYALTFGLGSGTISLMLAIRADYFGRRSFATITAVMGFVGGIVTAPISLLCVWLAGHTGNILTSLLLVSGGLAAAVLFFFSRPPGVPQEVSASARS